MNLKNCADIFTRKIIFKWDNLGIKWNTFFVMFEGKKYETFEVDFSGEENPHGVVMVGLRRL